MNLLSRSILALLTALALTACASVPPPATRAPNNPASPEAPEGPIRKLELFAPMEAPPPAMAQPSSPDAAMAGMDHSKMGHSLPEAKPATMDSPAQTYTCPMHPHIAEPKPGTCPICGMALVKKPKEKK